MADTASIAVRRDTAERRLQVAMEAIGKVTGVVPVTLPQYDPDRAYLEAWRLDALAGYAEQVATAVTGQDVTAPDYNAMTNAQLIALMHERGLTLDEGSGAGGNVLHQDREDALKADDMNAVERAEHEAYLNAMTHDELDAEGQRTNTEWPEAGSGSNGALLKADKVNALLAAFDAERADEDTDRNAAQQAPDEGGADETPSDVPDGGV